MCAEERRVQCVAFRTSPCQKILPYQVPNQKKVWWLWFGLTTIQHSVMLAKRRSNLFSRTSLLSPSPLPTPLPVSLRTKARKRARREEKERKEPGHEVEVKSFNSHFHCSAILQNTNSRDLDQKSWNEESYQRNYKNFLIDSTRSGSESDHLHIELYKYSMLFCSSTLISVQIEFSVGHSCFER